MASAPTLERTGFRTRTSVVVARDGQRLATRTTLPDGPPRAVLVARTPYGPDTHAAEAAYWAARDVAFVSQDVRGRGTSQGRWRPFRHERSDGVDTLLWLARQPWARSVPRIVVGASYDAFCAWEIARDRPDLVDGLISRVPVMDRRSVTLSPDGVLHLAGRVAWARAQLAGGPGRPLEAARMSRATWTRLPLTSMADDLGVRQDAWNESLGLDLDPAPAPPADVSLDVPALHIGGWFDPFVGSTLAASRRPAPGSAPRSSAPCRVVVGPWTHDLHPHDRIGRRVVRAPQAVNLPALELEWVRQVSAKPAAASAACDLTRTDVYVVGKDEWVELDAWPPRECVDTHLFLDASSGPMTLVPHRPARSSTRSYVYDPDRPAPDLLGPASQRPLTDREDVLSFTTDRLREHLEIVGDVRVRLHVDISAPTTDLVVRLTQLRADGDSLNLTHAITSISAAGGPQPIEVTLRPLAVLVPRGDALRLDVTSSCFPYYARNLNTGTDRRSEDRRVPAGVRLHCGAETPSSLTLPVRPGPQENR